MDKLFVLFIFGNIGLCVGTIKRRQIFGHQFPDNPFAGHHSGSLYDGGTSYGYQPCLPTHSMCSLNCIDGYVKGPNGCDFCSCRTGQDSSGSGSVYNHYPQSTSLPISGGSGAMFQPCLASQSHCPLLCAGGYTKGPGGCDFCMCAPTANFGHSTYGSFLIDPSTSFQPQTTQQQSGNPQTSGNQYGTAQSTTIQPATTQQPADACTIAKSSCVLACGPGGYLTDPSDCTVCVCKSSVLG